MSDDMQAFDLIRHLTDGELDALAATPDAQARPTERLREAVSIARSHKFTVDNHQALELMDLIEGAFLHLACPADDHMIGWLDSMSCSITQGLGDKLVEAGLYHRHQESHGRRSYYRQSANYADIIMRWSDVARASRDTYEAALEMARLKIERLAAQKDSYVREGDYEPASVCRDAILAIRDIFPELAMVKTSPPPSLWDVSESQAFIDFVVAAPPIDPATIPAWATQTAAPFLGRSK